MKKIVWALLDSRMGSVGQARGVLQALGSNYEVIEKNITYTKWAKLPNCLKGCSLLGVDKKSSSDLEAPYPDLVLSISRRTTPIARKIKKLSKGKTKIVQLIHPGKCGLEELDLVIVSEHDKGKKNPGNILYITGCPHRVSEKAMLEAKAKWEPLFADLPKPWTTVIVGGSIKGKPFAIENAKKLGQELKKIKQKIGGSILITDSKRTGAAGEQAIMDELNGFPAYTYLWGEKKENPIMGFWACADIVVATGDSVSMCSESCGSGKPVLIFTGKDWLTPKHERFVNSLYEGGYAIALEDEKALDFKPQKRLDPSLIIAKKINSLF